MRDIFATLADLERAPVHDLAGVLLNQLNVQGQHRFQRRNLVNTIAEQYMQDETASGSPDEKRRRARPLIAEAIGYLLLQGFVAPEYDGHIVTRLGRTIKTRQDFTSYAQRSLLPERLLRPDLAEIVLPLFLSGHYDDAVSAAFKRVEIIVRELGKFTPEDYGVDLMRAAFKANGPLTDKAAVKTESEALAHLFAGAIGFFKNPLSHREVGIDDARMAASRILFANELIALAHIQNIRIKANAEWEAAAAQETLTQSRSDGAVDEPTLARASAAPKVQSIGQESK
jgi:uncharacterized protein (TIGR02391 family)